MEYQTETDPNTGKCFFNPQQDIIDRRTKGYMKNIRKYQDLMAFFYFSYFIPEKERKVIHQVLTSLDKMYQVVSGDMGYHPDAERIDLTQSDYQAFHVASGMCKRHAVLGIRYRLRRFFQWEDVSKRVMMRLKGGTYFQKWQALQKTRE